MATVNLNIEGMHCGGCATGIEMVTAQLDGVSSAAVDLEGKKGVFEYDESKANPDQIIAAIAELGYTGTVAEA